VKVLISDANVLIDMEVGRLIQPMFQLPYQFHTPDILFEEELDEQHAYLLEMGLIKAPLSSDILQSAQQLMTKYPQPSRNDCFALALAANLSLPLLTGDKHLRSATKREGVMVMGSLWLFVEMENHGLVTKESLAIALKKMKDGGRRLPWRKAEAQRLSK
jgi:predicted nucleic acid-binding protein